MCVFRYNQDQKTNLLNFQKDLYIYFNTKLDSDEQIIKYTKLSKEEILDIKI